MKNYIGNPLQIKGAEQYILQNGKGNGMKFLYVRNGLGLEAWISLDRAGDVSRVNLRAIIWDILHPAVMWRRNIMTVQGRAS